MTAEKIASALRPARARQTSRGLTWRVRCPSHDDRHASLDITETPDGRVLVHCWSGCSQAEVIDALRERGLWSPTRGEQLPRAVADPFPASAFHKPTAPPCCFQGPCEHARRFNREMILAELFKNLREAAAEVVQLFETANYDLSGEELKAELVLAVEMGGSRIVPWRLDAKLVEQAIEIVADDFTKAEAEVDA
ncbi:MAG TPA: hypothetical protein VJX68_01025 [Candidatus Binatus sp.]|uniref:hypothetical protein n=1 Tax=Candidatus Binatus sp. TaxID=2811406 RepID=UPI002B46FB22|nr:hypothetical protein [Candidatus Binatus sp.]HKN11753.1 hypothetical protein [Candidatus Binatus sp.]